MVMGQTVFSFGEDEPGAILINDDAEVVLPLGLDQLTSQGSPVEITSTTNNGYVGTTATGETVFTFDLDPVSGKYTFVQILPLDHPDTTDPNDAIEINLGIAAIDADGDNASANVRIVLLDDGPVAVNGVGATDDTNLNDDGMDMVTGTINVNYGADGAGATTGNGDFTSSGNQLAGNLTSNGVPVDVSFNADTNTYVGTADGQTVFTMVINCLLYTSPSPRDQRGSRMPSSA